MVVALNHLKSSEIRQGISFPLPMTRFSLMAAMAFQGVVCDMRVVSLAGVCDMPRCSVVLGSAAQRERWPYVLDGYGSLNRRVGIVVDQFEVIEGEGIDGLHIGIDSHAWQLTWLARQLQLCLVYMIGVEMKVPESMDEIARFQIADLGHHHGQ